MVAVVRHLQLGAHLFSVRNRESDTGLWLSKGSESEFPHRIGIPREFWWKDEYVEAANWCNEQFPGRWRYKVSLHGEHAMYFCFQRVSDAVFFKLRWF